MVAGGVQPDAVEALVHGDVEDVFLIADAEIDVAGIARWLRSARLRLAGLDEPTSRQFGSTTRTPGRLGRRDAM